MSASHLLGLQGPQQTPAVSFLLYQGHRKMCTLYTDKVICPLYVLKVVCFCFLKAFYCIFQFISQNFVDGSGIPDEFGSHLDFPVEFWWELCQNSWRIFEADDISLIFMMLFAPLISDYSKQMSVLKKGTKFRYLFWKLPNRCLLNQRP